MTHSSWRAAFFGETERHWVPFLSLSLSLSVSHSLYLSVSHSLFLFLFLSLSLCFPLAMPQRSPYQMLHGEEHRRHFLEHSLKNLSFLSPLRPPTPNFSKGPGPEPLGCLLTLSRSVCNLGAMAQLTSETLVKRAEHNFGPVSLTSFLLPLLWRTRPAMHCGGVTRPNRSCPMVGTTTHLSPFTDR